MCHVLNTGLLLVFGDIGIIKANIAASELGYIDTAEFRLGEDLIVKTYFNVKKQAIAFYSSGSSQLTILG